MGSGMLPLAASRQRGASASMSELDKAELRKKVEDFSARFELGQKS
jgi:hypothetical protein